MSQLDDIHAVVADRIRATGVDSVASVFDYEPDDYPLPAIIVGPPEDGVYVTYHGTFGAMRLQEVNLVVTIYVPIGTSQESAARTMAAFLSSGTSEDSSLADAITGNEVPIGSGRASIHAAVAENYGKGTLTRAQTTPCRKCEIPVAVRVTRS
jgi:hypothetical protein